jgi:hypothetical protein
MLAVAGLAAVFAAPLQAQVPLLDIRVGAHAVSPTGDLADAFDAGFGAYGRVGVPLGIVKVMGSVTWNRFTAASPLVDDQDEITLQVGPHFSLLPMLDIGFELAQFTDASETGYSTNVSVGLLKFEATAAYHSTFKSPQANWVSVGVGIRF